MVSCFIRKDHRHIRANNMQTLETRAAAFATWLAKMDFDDESLVELDSSSAAAMLCTYVEEQAESMLNK